MSDQPEKKHKPGLGERIRARLRAAEVAAEESAGQGFVTEAVEAVEAAVNPEHELGPQRHGDTARDADEHDDTTGTPKAD
ncbi:MAG: hypothetical protein ACREN2_04760 [Candidatus Dormibacteria bacterium]